MAVGSFLENKKTGRETASRKRLNGMKALPHEEQRRIGKQERRKEEKEDGYKIYYSTRHLHQHHPSPGSSSPRSS